MPADRDVGSSFDDGFEGSIHEHLKFAEVFFGDDQDKTSNKCLVTAAINFQCEKSKGTDALLSLNNVTPKGNSAPGVSPYGHSLSIRDDNVTDSKQTQMLLDEQISFNTVTSRLVEFSSGSITSSCYLLKGDVPMRSLPSFKGDEDTNSSSKVIPPLSCQIEDEDLLVSATCKKKTSRFSAKKSTLKTKPYKPKPFRKHKTQKGSCRLHPRSLGKRGNHNEGKRFASGPRTVLSWLINCGSVSLKEVIQFRDLKDNAVVKEGLITKDGIVCICCNEVLSFCRFKSHAGFTLNEPSVKLVMKSGKLYTLCLLEAWSNEYRTRQNATRPVEVEDMDQNDDSCGLCGNGGELICCDNCPSAFHQNCLPEQEFPEGDWYCQYCTCRICGNLVDDKHDVITTGALKCLQCDHKYHDACLKEKVSSLGVGSEGFCGRSCQEVYLGLQSHVGVPNHLSDGFSCTLLKCIHEELKVDSAENCVALKAECNLKLSVALTIMEECFQSMVDARTGIDMIPHTLYNLGSEFARLNFHGFYTMVLEEDDVLISAASVRIHGVTVAEMPLIATCSKYRRQGMCRRLMNSIEEMLRCLKVEKLVITAISDVVDTWTDGFGFEPLEDHEKKSLGHINLMVFPGTVWLKKTIHKNQATNEQTSVGHVERLRKDDEAQED